MKKIVSLIVFIYSFQFIVAQDTQIPKLNIKAYLNDKEIDSPVYENIYDTKLFGSGVYYLSSFVKLTSIFNLLGAEVKVDGNVIDIVEKNIGHIQFVYENEANIAMKSFNNKIPHITKSKYVNQSIILIDSEFYISLSTVCSLINGYLNDNENSVILYTKDYERLDIPLTLSDCYLALDSLLNTETKENIKKGSDINLAEYHMSLGMWIRNKWVRQSRNRIKKLFYDYRIVEPDSISGIIIKGYHYYLNNINKTIEELINEGFQDAVGKGIYTITIDSIKK
jgi:hypothetical protein